MASPLFTHLLKQNSVPPEFVGSLGDVSLVSEAGKQFVERAGELREVVVASAVDAKVS